MPRRDKGDEVAITGMGVVSPIGNSIDDFWNSSVEGRPGISRIERFDTSCFACRVAGQVTGLRDHELFKAKYASLDPVTAMSLVATGQAMAEAGIPQMKEHNPEFGVFYGTGIGGITTHEAECEKFFSADTPRLHPLAIVRVMCNSAASEIAMHYGLAGPSLTISTACASGAQAIGEAYAAIRQGRLELAVAGGADAPLSKPLFASWNAMRVLSDWDGNPEGACRPFSKDRRGLVLAEGAAFVVLERADHARKRGADVLGYIHGYGSTTSVEHITYPSLVHEQHALKKALEQARLDADQIDYVHAHGTGTEANDPVETQVLKEVFGTRAYEIPVSSSKSMYGHTLGASGVLGCITALLCLKHGVAVPTINLGVPDPDCDLNYVPNEAQSLKRTRYAVASAYGFGGNNASLIVSAD